MTSTPSHMRAVETRIADVGRDLADSLCKILDAIPGGPHRPNTLAKQLGLNAVLTSRLLKAAHQQDPLVVAHVIPGPEPLRRLLHAAEKQKVQRRLIQEATAAVDRFQQLIDTEAGDRSALDAIISGWLPDARQRVELIAKQSVFRGVSHLTGTSCDVAHYTFMVHPGATGTDRADQVSITNMQGLRRVRPGAPLTYDTVHAASRMLTLDGAPVENLRGLLLEQFCSSPVPELRVSHHGDVAQYTIVGSDVGVRSAVDIVHATYLPDKKQVRLRPGETPRTTRMAIGIDPPSRVLFFDVIIHDEIFPGQQPALDIFKTGGAIGPGPESRGDMDRLELMESIQSLGRGISALRNAESPRHYEIVQYACERRGWDPSRMRCFRCRIDYPMYSSEVVFSFHLLP